MEPQCSDFAKILEDENTSNEEFNKELAGRPVRRKEIRRINPEKTITGRKTDLPDDYWDPRPAQLEIHVAVKIDGKDVEYYISDETSSIGGVAVMKWSAPAARKVSERIGWVDEGWFVECIRSLSSSGSTINFFDDVGYAERMGRVQPGNSEFAAEFQISDEKQVNLIAPGALQHNLNASRDGRQSSVTATLQVEQKDLATMDNKRPIIIEGAPGTGKTIIGLYRADYLTDQESIKNVLYLGSSRLFIKHVSGRIRSGKIKTSTVAEHTQFVATGKDDGHTNIDTAARVGNRLVDSEEFWKIIERHHKDLMENIKRYPTEPLGSRKRMLLKKIQGDPTVRRDIDQGLLEDIIGNSKNANLFAAINLMVDPIDSKIFDYVIVDEAQDLSPFDWRIVIGSLKDPNCLTALGDLQQRKTRVLANDWKALTGVLEEKKSNDPITFKIQTAFRTTGKIMDWVYEYLGIEKFSINYLRAGVEPEVHLVEPSTDLYCEAARRVTEASKTRVGNIAIVTLEPEKVIKELVKMKWEGAEKSFWLEGKHLQLLDSQNMSGVEFNLALVIEPSEFKRESSGSALTALTRGISELMVLHTKPLSA